MNSSQRAHGFTLIEMLVSISLLGVIIAATFSLLPGMAQSNSATRDEQRATLIAKSFFERAAAAYATPTGYDQPPPAPENVTDGLSCAAPAVTSLNINASGQTNLQRVSLTCTLLGRTYAFQRDYARPR